METKKFTLMERIAKHGKQSIIVIPKMLENVLKPGEIVQISIEIIDK